VTSPLERCRETAAALLSGRDPAPPLHVDDRVGEVRYGSWTGRELKSLRKEPLWSVIQGRPSAAVFPDGEGLAEMSARAVAAVRAWNAAIGPDATYALVSHADVIKAILADALGLHLDGFQRIAVDPCALSVVRYTAHDTHVERVNDTGGAVAGLASPPGRSPRRRATRGPAR
jgi:probable phosphomutase (TIGR03848 family)